MVFSGYFGHTGMPRVTDEEGMDVKPGPHWPSLVASDKKGRDDGE